MKVLGLTGGVGMGKSASAQLLRERGVPVVDTDDLARQVVELGQPGLAEVQQAFGPEIVGADGRLRRQELAQRVFADPAARKRLEDILHPRIRALWRAQVEAWRQEGCPLAVVVIPLLFETKAEAELDPTICVACSVATQKQRLLARGHILQGGVVDGRAARGWRVAALPEHRVALDAVVEQAKAAANHRLFI